MGIHLVILFCIALLPSLSQAENSDFVKLYHYFTNNYSCAKVDRSELEKIGKQACYRGAHAADSASHAAFETFNWQAFQVAAQNQLDKNACIADQISEVLADEGNFTSWNSIATAAWLGYKKSQLILKKCEKYLRTITPTMTDQKVKAEKNAEDKRARAERKKYKEELATPTTDEEKRAKAELPTSDKMDKWDRRVEKDREQEEWNKNFYSNVCENSEVLSLLNQARALFQYTVPVASSPEMLDAIEKNRHAVTNAKTGKPLTDNEILQADLRDLSFVRLEDQDPKLKSATRSFLEKVGKERRQSSNIISASEKNGSFDLSSKTKQYIYEDDTLFQTLASKGLMSPNHEGLGSATPKTLSTGAFCLLMRYEPSASGEIIKFAAETAAAGGVAYKGAKAATEAAIEFWGATKAAKMKNTLKNAGMVGLVTSGVPMLAKQVLHACDLTITQKAQKGENVAKTVESVAKKATSLPSEFGDFTRYSLRFRISKIPTCYKVEDTNLLIHKNSAGFKCAMETLLGIAPLKYGVPGSLIDIDQ